MLIIGVSIIIIPKMTNELLETMAQSSIYIRAIYKPRPEHKHILVCGDLRSTSILEFFSELFHADHENANLYVVILCPHPPTNEMKLLLKDPFLSMSVIYLEGTPLSERDLERARADTAQAVFILTNKFSTQPDEEDSKTILQQFSIKRYNQFSPPGINALYCIQLIRPENRRHLVNSTGATKKVGEDLVVCLNEIKMGVIAKSVLFPGTSTLIMNLLTSVNSDGPQINEKEDTESDTDSDSEEEEEMEEESNWLDEYKKGCDWEIYTTELSDMFEGGNFSKLSESMYRRLGVVLFALQVQEIANPNNNRVLLNPSSFVIPPKSDYHIHGLVMAQNKTQSDLSYSALQQSLAQEGADVSLFARLSDISNTVNVKSRRRYDTNQTINKNDNNSNSPKSTNTGKVSNSLASPKKVHGFGGLLSIGEGNEDDENNSTVIRNNANTLQRRVKGQMALMKRFKEIKVSTDSEQEKMHKLEEEYMQNNFYMRAKPSSLADATVETSVLKEFEHINNHIIITGKGISNLYDLVRPLREKGLGPLKYIVILYPYDLSHAVWRLISNFEGIFFVKGSPLEEEDIRRAGIFRATHVVIMADSSTTRISAASGTSAGLEALADADAIFAYKAMRRLNDTANIVVEIVKQSNIGYLDLNVDDDCDDIVFEEADYRFTPQFASGELFTSSLLDTIVCQAFYNPQIVAVVHKLISSRDQTEVTAAVNNATLSVKFKSPTKMVSLESTLSSSLYQIPIPKEFHGGRYGDLFKQMAIKGILPLGLYRGVDSKTHRGIKMNTLPYVYTNPPESTELFPCDKIFVLATKPVHIAHLSMEAVAQRQILTREIHNFELAKQHRGSMKNSIQVCNRLSSFVQRFQLVTGAVQNLLGNKSIEIKTHLQDILEYIDAMKTQDLTLFSLLVPQTTQRQDSITNKTSSKENSEDLILAMMSSESRRIKYVIEYYLPKTKDLKNILKNNENNKNIDSSKWKPLKDAIKILFTKSETDEFKLLSRCLHILNVIFNFLILL